MITIEDVFALKARLNKLKQQLKLEQIPDYQKAVADHYLNLAMNAVEETLRS